MTTALRYSPEQLLSWDHAHSWHPFTHMRQYMAQEPIIIQRGCGVRIQDVHGRWYYDGCSSIWLNVHGHCVPAIDAAIRAQLNDVAHATMLGQANVPATVLARRLVELAPSGLTRVHFSDSGASAVEIAVKIAIQYWHNRGEHQRRRILGFHNNYHGDTLGAMAVAPSELFHKPFLDLLPVNPRIPFPRCADRPLVHHGETCDPSLADDVCNVLADTADDIAAVIIEPVQGAGGMIPAPPGYLRLLRQICDELNLLMIVDEIATGFGHTGYLFACTAECVTPDILCLGKGLTGGYLPVAVTMTTESVFDAFLGEVREGKTLYHGHSFAGNPLGCAAALASLDLLAELLPTLPEKVLALAEMLQSFAHRAFVGEVRQRGFMVGIKLSADASNRSPFDWSSIPGYVVAKHARRHGLLIRSIGSTVILMPAPASTIDDLRAMIERLGCAFDDSDGELRELAMKAVAG